MNIELKNVTVHDVCTDYFNDAENELGVGGYDGQLNIRPKFQRNYVYKDAQRDEVIRSILKRYPLNVFYWVDLGEDRADQDSPRYEVLDGQQRTISVCDYVNGDYSVDGKYFHSLPQDQKDTILGYELFVYVCAGTDSEKLEWFRIINIAGEKLTDQELRNAVYSGPWVSDAKRYFSKTGGAAYKLAGDYLNGDANRQDYMETAIKWHAELTKESIENYMSRHQDEPTAQELWSYFRSVIEWVQSMFPKVRSQMKGLPWGTFYNQHHDCHDLDPKALEARIQVLLADDDVTKSKGIYEYLLTDDVRCLNIRQFPQRDRDAAYERQHHKCAICDKGCDLKDMHADHILPWSKGGHTTPGNCQMLCTKCNLAKGNDI